ncbi:MAG: hypothetical protein QXQ94_06305 [Candidatus Bathyarchaeia archaeon]
MTNINKTLLAEIKPHFGRYNCDFYEMEHFLNHRGSFLERQAEAICIIEGIMTAHGKEKLIRHVSELARVEHGIHELEPWVRDHVVHALLSFILGIYINEKILRPHHIPVDDFQWKLAGMFHDIGYPAEIANGILKPFIEKINDIKRTLLGRFKRPDVRFKVIPVGLESLQNNVNSFDLIQNRLNEWDLKIDARREYDLIVESGNVDHGIISSLAILYVIDLMYQKHNPKREYKDRFIPGTNISFNQKYFEEDVVSACTAIYIHNLPKRSFCNSKIDRIKAPVAFLLKLSDCLQEWERPSFTNKFGFPANKFDVNVSNKQLIFHADIPYEKKKKIRDDISSFLIAQDVQIC